MSFDKKDVPSNPNTFFFFLFAGDSADTAGDGETIASGNAGDGPNYGQLYLYKVSKL